MIFLWALLFLLWVILAVHYIISYREWRREDILRREDREAVRSGKPLPYDRDTDSVGHTDTNDITV